MSAIDAVPLTVDKLNDVVSELSLHNLRDLAFLVHIESHSGEFGDEA